MAGTATSFAIEPGLVRNLKRAEYERLVELGAFEDERIELLKGILVTMSPRHAPLASTVEKLTQLLVQYLAGRLRVRVQLPLALGDDSEPEPDLAVVVPGDYDHAHPSSAVLVIEVADTSLAKDRQKAQIYAAAGVGTYWIVNLLARTVEVHTSPEGDRYGEVHTLHEQDTLRVAALAEVAVRVGEILPAQR